MENKLKKVKSIFLNFGHSIAEEKEVIHNNCHYFEVVARHDCGLGMRIIFLRACCCESILAYRVYVEYRRWHLDIERAYEDGTIIRKISEAIGEEPWFWGYDNE